MVEYTKGRGYITQNLSLSPEDIKTLKSGPSSKLSKNARAIIAFFRKHGKWIEDDCGVFYADNNPPKLQKYDYTMIERFIMNHFDAFYASAEEMVGGGGGEIAMGIIERIKNEIERN